MSVRVPPSKLRAAVESRLPGIYSEIWSDVAALLTAFPGTQVTSWWRDASSNERVGGAQSSQHLAGLAVDVVPPRSDWPRAAQFLRVRNWKVIDEGDHLHAQVFKASERVSAFVRSVARYA